MTDYRFRTQRLQSFAEDDLLPISLIQHWLFCKRRAALVLFEGVWEDNYHTVSGRIFHDNVDTARPATIYRKKVRIARSLRVRSLRYGITGVADVVEFRHAEQDHTLSEYDAELLAIPAPMKNTTAYPIEYKIGKRRQEKGYILQLCAQALCIEEMCGISVPEGALYFGKTRRRLDITFSRELRAEAVDAISALHSLWSSLKTPPPELGKKCTQCSFHFLCRPETVQPANDPARYLQKVIRENSKP